MPKPIRTLDQDLSAIITSGADAARLGKCSGASAWSAELQPMQHGSRYSLTYENGQPPIAHSYINVSKRRVICGIARQKEIWPDARWMRRISVGASSHDSAPNVLGVTTFVIADLFRLNDGTIEGYLQLALLRERFRQRVDREEARGAAHCRRMPSRASCCWICNGRRALCDEHSRRRLQCRSRIMWSMRKSPRGLLSPYLHHDRLAPLQEQASRSANVYRGAARRLPIPKRRNK